MLEWYRYNLYGKPSYWDNTNTQIPSSNHQVKDLHGGTRWMPELGLYDDRNRFMSPELGRFLQPDPIGFKGDASNLYRYCGNDWANRTDPMGLEGGVTTSVSDLVRWAAKIAKETAHAIARDKAMQHAISWNPGGGIRIGQLQANINVLQSLGQQLGASMTIAQMSVESKPSAPSLDPSRIGRAVDLYHQADERSDQERKFSYTHLKDGRVVEGISKQVGRQWVEQTAPGIKGIPRENGHLHPEGKLWAPFSQLDKNMGASAYVVKNHDKSDKLHPGAADLYHRGWEYRLNKANEVIDGFPNP